MPPFMYPVVYSWFLCLLIVLTGCVFKKPSIETRKIGVPDIVTGQVIHPERLNAQGRLWIEPFKAGPNAAATPELDALALRMVKGIADTLDESNSSWAVITDSGPENCDFILTGYIEEYDTSGKFQRWVKHKNQPILKIKAELHDAHNRDYVLALTGSLKGNKKKSKSQDVAYELGQHIAQTLVRLSRERSAGGSNL